MNTWIKSGLMAASLGLSLPLWAQPAGDSLDLKIGQMIMVGVPSTQVDAATRASVYQGKIGGLLLFEKNIAPQKAYARLKEMVWQYKTAAPLPLWVAIDQEGGKVNRLKEKYGFPRSISAAAMGRSMDSTLFYGASTAGTLAGLGIDVNLAPVVDLAVNPTSPAIAGMRRSFSADGDSVARYAKAFIGAHRHVGVATALKHFPGHGSARGDTHLGLTDVTETWTEQELIPYKKLIEEGYADIVMSAHIVNKNLDAAGLPGTLSKPVLTGLLRHKLGYDGVVISDDMQMHAITQYFGFEEALKMALDAGIDVLVFSNNIRGSQMRTADRVHALIRGWVRTGEIAEERINKSFERIMRLKKLQAAAGYPCAPCGR